MKYLILFLILICTVISAQDYPTDFDKLIWLRADTLRTMGGGDSVNVWGDASGNSNDATYSAGEKFHYDATGFQNSKPTMEQGTNDPLNTVYTFASEVSTNSCVEYFVYYRSTNSGGQKILYKDGSNYQRLDFSNPNGIFQLRAGGTIVSAVDNTGYHWVKVINNSNDVTIYVDGDSLANGTVAGNIAFTQMGSNIRNGFKIAEIIVIDGVPTTDSLTNLENNYLLPRYDFALPEPTTQPSGLTFTAVKNAAELSWTSGDGSNDIVVMKEGGAVNSDPVDGTSYTANTTFGSGTEIGTGNYVVYNSTSTSVTVTGLTPGKTYHVALYAFNGSGGDEDYLTTSPLTGNKATSAAAPLKIATWNYENMHYNTNDARDSLSMYLDSLDFDLICTQESYLSWYEGFGDTLGVDGEYDAWYRPWTGAGNVNGFTWRTTIFDTVLTDTSFVPSDSVPDSFTKRPAVAQFNFNHGLGETVKINVMSFHFNRGGSTTEKDTAMMAIKDYTDSLLNIGIESIICGDFNDSLDHPTLDIFARFKNDANYDILTSRLSDNTVTYLGPPTEFIDHIIITQGLVQYADLTSIKSNRIDQVDANYETRVSDHVPVSYEMQPSDEKKNAFDHFDIFDNFLK